MDQSDIAMRVQNQMMRTFRFSRMARSIQCDGPFRGVFVRVEGKPKSERRNEICTNMSKKKSESKRTKTKKRMTQTKTGHKQRNETMSSRHTTIRHQNQNPHKEAKIGLNRHTSSHTDTRHDAACAGDNKQNRKNIRESLKLTHTPFKLYPTHTHANTHAHTSSAG